MYKKTSSLIVFSPTTSTEYKIKPSSDYQLEEREQTETQRGPLRPTSVTLRQKHLFWHQSSALSHRTKAHVKDFTHATNRPVLRPSGGGENGPSIGSLSKWEFGCRFYLCIRINVRIEQRE